MAVLTSVKAVWENPFTMALWGLIVATSLAIGFLLLFVGLAVVVPILAHSSWHLAKALSASSRPCTATLPSIVVWCSLQGGLLRVPIKVLQSEFERSAHIRNLFVSYSETLLAQIQQTVQCNSMHTTRKRICRWLLMMHDRADGENLSYTHEFLAHVLSTTRKSVTLAAQALQREGLITYHRGNMQVLDRLGLEKASCECYAIVKERFDAFLTPPQTAVQDNTQGRK